MMYKKIFTILFLGVCSTKGFCQSDMYVKSKTNEQTIIPLSEIETLRFASGKLSFLTTDGNSTTYSLSALRYISFAEYQDTDPGTGTGGGTGTGDGSGTDTDGGTGTGTSTGIFDQAASTSLSLFPNPVKSRLFIQSSEIKDVEIINALGEVVLYFNSLPEAGVDVSSLASGMYLCRIQQTNTQIIKRFIKE